MANPQSEIKNQKSEIGYLVGGGLKENFRVRLTVDPLSADPSGDLAVTEVGSFGAPDGVPVHSIQFTYNPADRRFYGIELGPSPSFDPTGQLLGIAPDTGAAARVGAPLAQALHALAFQTDGGASPPHVQAADALGAV